MTLAKTYRASNNDARLGKTNSHRNQSEARCFNCSIIVTEENSISS